MEVSRERAARFCVAERLRSEVRGVGMRSRMRFLRMLSSSTCLASSWQFCAAAVCFLSVSVDQIVLKTNVILRMTQSLSVYKMDVVVQVGGVLCIVVSR